ncbi:MAG: SxtJ family membrane protein [Acidobacteria bacterium]|nr:SxtJ family membrane protein [Acidobacteriota bacterium]
MITFAAVFTILAVAPLIHHRPVRFWALGVAAVFSIVALSRPSLLHGANRAWMRFGLLLSRVVSPIMMAAIYYLAITPVALIIRRFGANLLSLGFDRARPSYWIERDPPGPSPESMSQQF